MSISKNWMEEDNCSEFVDRSKKQLLNSVIEDCIIAVHMSTDAGRRFKKPGEAIEWYLKRIPKEESAYIRSNFKSEHMNAKWSELTKSIVQDSDDRDIVEKYPRRSVEPREIKLAKKA